MTRFAFIRTLFLPAALGCALTLALPAQAADHGGHAMNHGAATHAATTDDAVYQATGTVKRWGDTDVSITHDPVTELHWPVMTMSFSLPQSSHIAALPEGSRIVFSFRQSADGYELTHVSPITQ